MVSGAVAYVEPTTDCRTAFAAMSHLDRFAFTHSIALGVTCFAISLIAAFVSLVPMNASFAAPIRLDSVPVCFTHSLMADRVGDFTELATAHSIFAVAAQVFPTLPNADAAPHPANTPTVLSASSSQSLIVLSLRPYFLAHSLTINSSFSDIISESDLLSLPCVFCNNDCTAPVIAFANGTAIIAQSHT
jgi:uncharacterized membrane protein